MFREANNLLELQRCLRDLIALSVLPLAWKGSPQQGIAEKLADTLLRIQFLDFVYVRFDGSPPHAPVEAARIPARPHLAQQPSEVWPLLRQLLEPDSPSFSLRVANPVAEGNLHLAVLPIEPVAGIGGTIIVGTEREGFPSELDRLILGMATNQAALAVREQIAQAALADRLREARLMAEVGLTLTCGEEVQAKLQRCMDSLVRHLDLAIARVWTLQEREPVLELQGSAGLDTVIDGFAGDIRLGHSTVGRLAESGTPCLWNDITEADHLQDREWAKRHGIVAFVAVPLRVGDKLIGIIAAFARQFLPDVVFQQIGSVANAIALGVVRQRAEAAREESLRREQTMSSQLRGLTLAAMAIHSTLNLNEVMRLITEQARTIIGAHLSVTSTTVEQRWAQAINAVSLSDKYAGYRNYAALPDGSGIYSVVCRENRAMRLTQAELQAHPTWRSFGHEDGRHPPLRGWLAAPLIGHDRRNLGLIQVSDKYEGEFSQQDEDLLLQLAHMASTAIEHVQLFQKVEQEAKERKKAQEALQDKIRDLELFHDVVVGRELKMMELEKELEHLKQAPGITARGSQHQ